MQALTISTTVGSSDVDQCIAGVRDDTWPAVRDIEGCLGLSLLVDRHWRLPVRKPGHGEWGTRLRETARLVVSTAWESEESLRSSRERALALTVEVTERAGSEASTVDEWELTSFLHAHPTGPGTPVRTALSRVNPANVRQALDYYHGTLLPQLEQLEGFASATLLLNRANGSSVLSLAFDSREALEATRDEADYLRARSSHEVDVEFLDFAEFELVLSQFQAPARA